MIKPFIIGLVLSSIIIFFLSSLMNHAHAADTNTVSSTVIDKSVPTANSPSVVINNSDVCKTGVASAVQTQILGISSAVTIRDENCEILKLSRQLYSFGMKVAAVSLLANAEDGRVFDAMWYAGTYPPVDGKIGNEAKEFWLENTNLIPEGSKIKEGLTNQKQVVKENKQTIRGLNDFEKFVIMGMAMYIGFPILF